MVQNQLNQPGIEQQQSLRFSSTKPRMRMGSQPIKPLKLPAITRLNLSDSSISPEQVSPSIAQVAEPAAIEPNQVGLAPVTPTITAKQSRSSQARLQPMEQPQSNQSKLSKVPARSLARNLAKTQAASQSALMGAFQRLPKLKKETWQWLILWGTLLSSFGGITGLAFLWLASPPPSVDCQKVSLGSLGAQRLYCAQELARSGELTDLTAGITLLENWSADQPLYDEAQQAVTDWSKIILVIAHRKIAQNDMQAAIAAAAQIPPSSSVYLKAQEEIKAWRQEWQSGEGIVSTAQNAIKAQDWKLASEQVVELGRLHHEYWRINQADVLFKQIVREKQARQNLTQAQKLAKQKTPDKLAEAIGLLAQIPGNAHSSAEAQAALQQWSQELIQVGLQQWWDGDRAGAFATALKIPLSPNLPVEGLDLIRLSQANQLVTPYLSAESTAISLSELWHLTEAVAAVKKIGADSPFYEEAQAAQQTWQMHLEDLTQLGFANLMARSGDRASLEFAINQSNQVAPDSPRRTQAQSLIARWQQDIQALEDQPYLARAQRWAASDKIPDLRTAIAQVGQIPAERAAWQKAQDLIAQWTAQIQRLEDQPIWDQAQKLATQGKLSQAIEVAAQIPAERALYTEAQSAIAAWKAKIQAAEIAEDQPILDRAYSLAATERLTMAIDAAAQIAPGRALYSEAQAAIKAWDKQRQDIWNAGGPATPGAADAEPNDSSEAASESAASESAASETTDIPVAEETPEDSTGMPTGDTDTDTAIGSTHGFEGYYDEGYQQE